MRFLVCSDSHGRVSSLFDMLARAHTKRFPADAVLFLGDGLRDLSYLSDEGIPIFRVAGNCDLCRTDAPDEELLSFEGHRIFMTHGDRYSVKSGEARLVAAASGKGADVVLYGHTHVPSEHYYREGDTVGGVRLARPTYVMNPGSVGEYRGSSVPGFAVLELSPSGVSWSRVDLF